jgi:predicted nucleic acid-binding protein
MAKRLTRRYFDSATIIRYVMNAPEAAIIDRLLEEAAAKRWQLVVCAVSFVEVSRSPNEPVDLARFARIHSFFDNDYIYPQEVDRLLADDALKLIYDYSWLRPMDALHVAAALRTGCEVFYTYDGDLLTRMNGERGLRVEVPELPPEPEPEPEPAPMYKLLFGLGDTQDQP